MKYPFQCIDCGTTRDVYLNGPCEVPCEVPQRSCGCRICSSCEVAHECLPACPICGSKPHVERYWRDVAIYCDNCYDGAPDAGRQASVCELTRAKTFEAWRVLCAEWDE